MLNYTSPPPAYRHQDYDQTEQLRIQNQELQEKLVASEQREAKLSKQVEDYRAKLDEVYHRQIDALRHAYTHAIILARFLHTYH